MNDDIVKNLVGFVYPKSVNPHKPTIGDILHPDIRVLCGTHKMYDVSY